MAGFKDFVMRGNVIDLAVGVIIGGAFGSIVDSMVKDVIMPIIGAAGGAPDFSSITAGPIKIGNFVNAVVSFLILAAVVYFVIVKPYTALQARMQKPAPPPAPAGPPPPTDVELLGEIRDILRKNASAVKA